MATTEPSRSREPELAALRRAMARFETLARQLTPADLERRTPCAGWRVRDVLAHQVSVFEWQRTAYWQPVLDGRPTVGVDLRDLSRVNQAGVDRYRDAPDLPRLVGPRYAAALDVLEALVAEGKLDVVGSYLGAASTRAAVCTTTMDVWTHTWDVWRATGKGGPPDPTICTAVLPLVVEQVLPLAFDPARAGSLSCTYRMQATDIPGGEWAIAVERGTIRVERRAIARAQVTMRARAATFILVNLGRVHPLKAILTGHLACRGNPLLGLRFSSLMVAF